MRKFLILGVFILVLSTTSTVFASDTSSSTVKATSMITLDKASLSHPTQVPDIGELTISSFEFTDEYRVLWENNSYTSDAIKSGKEAEFLILFFDILNSTNLSTDYTKLITGELQYSDKAVYAGWVGQRNYDISDNLYVHEKNIYQIMPFYVGHYSLIFKVPNYVISDESNPLQILMKIGETKIKYQIR